MPTPPSSTAGRTTSSPSKKKYQGKHCYWAKWLDGNTRSYWSTIAQDRDPVKLRGMLRRIFKGKMHKVAIIHHYYDGTLMKMYYSDYRKWFTLKEYEAYLEEKRKARREATLTNSSPTPKQTTTQGSPPSGDLGGAKNQNTTQ